MRLESIASKDRLEERISFLRRPTYFSTSILHFSRYSELAAHFGKLVGNSSSSESMVMNMSNSSFSGSIPRLFLSLQTVLQLINNSKLIS